MPWIGAVAGALGTIGAAGIGAATSGPGPVQPVKLRYAEDVQNMLMPLAMKDVAGWGTNVPQQYLQGSAAKGTDLAHMFQDYYGNPAGGGASAASPMAPTGGSPGNFPAGAPNTSGFQGSVGSASPGGQFYPGFTPGPHGGEYYDSQGNLWTLDLSGHGHMISQGSGGGANPNTPVNPANIPIGMFNPGQSGLSLQSDTRMQANPMNGFLQQTQYAPRPQFGQGGGNMATYNGGYGGRLY